MNLFSDTVKNFIIKFQNLSKNYKRIFRYLQYLAVKFPSVFPSIPTMAKEACCSESTAKRAIRFFKFFGFINVQKVAYQSNNYYMNKDLIKLNTFDEEIYTNAYLEQSNTQNGIIFDPVSGLYSYKEKDTSTGSVSVDNYIQENNQKNRPIQQCLKISSLSTQQQQDLSNKFSEYALVNALKDAIWYDGQKNKILSMVKYLWNRAEAHSLNLV